MNGNHLLVVLLVFCCCFAQEAFAVDEPVLPKTLAKVEVVFCIDTTGSMGDLIAGAQAKIWSIVNGIISGKPVPKIRVGLVAYRDRGEEYVTQVTDLTTDLDAVHQKLFAFQAAGGGDQPEDVNMALADAVRKISWSPKEEKVYRVVFLVGDQAPHMNYTDQALYPEICKEAAEKDIMINAIRCGGDPEADRTFRDIANKADGQYASIAQSGGVSVVSTPYDAEMAELSSKLVGTGVFVGSKELRESAKKATARAMAEVDEARESKNFSKLAVEADKSEFRAKTAEAAMSAPSPSAGADMGGMGMGDSVGKADILDKFARDNEAALQSVKTEELPDEMKRMSDVERKKYLEKKVSERKEIQTKIDELGKNRAQFLADETKKSGSGDKSFDAVVLEMLKKQGGKKGIDY